MPGELFKGIVEMLLTDSDGKSTVEYNLSFVNFGLTLRQNMDFFSLLASEGTG